MRQLSIPSIRDRVVQGAMKLILEPIFGGVSPGSYGYRPKKSAHAAIQRVAKAILESKTYVIEFDLRSYFDTVKHHMVLEKVAQRVDDVFLALAHDRQRILHFAVTCRSPMFDPPVSG